MKRIAASLSSISAFFLATSVALADESGKLGNPLNSSIGTIPQFLATVLKIVVMVAIPIIALLIVYSGFLFVFARGNEGALSEAKRNFLYVIIGAILVLGAWVLATLLAGTISQLTTG